MNRYNAQKQFWKTIKTGGNTRIADAVIMTRLKVEVELCFLVWVQLFLECLVLFLRNLQMLKKSKMRKKIRSFLGNRWNTAAWSSCFISNLISEWTVCCEISERSLVQPVKLLSYFSVHFPMVKIFVSCYFLSSFLMILYKIFYLILMSLFNKFLINHDLCNVDYLWQPSYFKFHYFNSKLRCFTQILDREQEASCPPREERYEGLFGPRWQRGVLVLYPTLL